MKTLGESLRNAREAKSLTQKEVSKKTGIHNKTISNYENNVSSPDPDALKTFADIYETSVDYLLGRSEHYSGGNPGLNSAESCRYIDVSSLPDDAIRQVEEYAELLKLKYKEGRKREPKSNG